MQNFTNSNYQQNQNEKENNQIDEVINNIKTEEKSKKQSGGEKIEEKQTYFTLKDIDIVRNKLEENKNNKNNLINENNDSRFTYVRNQVEIFDSKIVDEIEKDIEKKIEFESIDRNFFESNNYLDVYSQNLLNIDKMYKLHFIMNYLKEKMKIKYFLHAKYLGLSNFIRKMSFLLEANHLKPLERFIEISCFFYHPDIEYLSILNETTTLDENSSPELILNGINNVLEVLKESISGYALYKYMLNVFIESEKHGIENKTLLNLDEYEKTHNELSQKENENLRAYVLKEKIKQGLLANNAVMKFADAFLGEIFKCSKDKESLLEEISVMHGELENIFNESKTNKNYEMQLNVKTEGDLNIKKIVEGKLKKIHIAVKKLNNMIKLEVNLLRMIEGHSPDQPEEYLSYGYKKICDNKILNDEQIRKYYDNVSSYASNLSLLSDELINYDPEISYTGKGECILEREYNIMKEFLKMYKNNSFVDKNKKINLEDNCKYYFDNKNREMKEDLDKLKSVLNNDNIYSYNSNNDDNDNGDGYSIEYIDELRLVKKKSMNDLNLFVQNKKEQYQKIENKIIDLNNDESEIYKCEQIFFKNDKENEINECEKNINPIKMQNESEGNPLKIIHDEFTKNKLAYNISSGNVHLFYKCRKKLNEIDNILSENNEKNEEVINNKKNENINNIWSYTIFSNILKRKKSLFASEYWRGRASAETFELFFKKTLIKNKYFISTITDDELKQKLYNKIYKIVTDFVCNDKENECDSDKENIKNKNYKDIIDISSDFNIITDAEQIKKIQKRIDSEDTSFIATIEEKVKTFLQQEEIVRASIEIFEIFEKNKQSIPSCITNEGLYDKIIYKIIKKCVYKDYFGECNSGKEIINMANKLIAMKKREDFGLYIDKEEIKDMTDKIKNSQLMKFIIQKISSTTKEEVKVILEEESNMNNYEQSQEYKI